MRLGDVKTLDGVSYYEVISVQDDMNNGWRVIGYIRENITEQKVYYRPKLSRDYAYRDMPERLLYDFNAKVGNTWKTYDNIDSYDKLVTVTIDSIDSVVINNQQHKRIYASSSCEVSDFPPDTINHIWIDGIGDIKGLVDCNRASYHLTGVDSVILTCFYRNEELIYKNETEPCPPTQDTFVTEFDACTVDMPHWSIDGRLFDTIYLINNAEEFENHFLCDFNSQIDFSKKTLLLGFGYREAIYRLRYKLVKENNVYTLNVNPLFLNAPAFYYWYLPLIVDKLLPTDEVVVNMIYNN